MIQPDDIRAVAPEFGAETNDLISTFITMASQRLSVEVWGMFYGQAVTYLTAHLLCLRTRRGAAGSMTEAKVGDVQVQYQAPMASQGGDQDYMQTTYGLEFLRLRRLVVITPIVV